MPETQRVKRPALVLARELIEEQRPNLIIVAGFLVAGFLLQQFFPASDAAQAVVFLLVLNAFILIFYAFTRTESNPRRDRRGFPARYFTLPVSTLTLIAVPLVLGIVAIEVAVVWAQGFQLVAVDKTEAAWSAWVAFKTGAFMVTYQMLLWCAARLGAMRMVVIGLSSFGFIVLEFSTFTAVMLILWCIVAFVLSWIGVARQRSGLSGARTGFGALADTLAEALPQRTRPFGSMHRAQVWYEWRKVGYLLPMLVCVVLLAIVLPISWLVGPERGFALLVFTLLLPALLAAPVGKAFSKADTWSMDTTVSEFAEGTRPLAVPAFLAVRPLSSDAVVIAKLHAAVLSAALAWVQVLAFVLLWQFGWVNTSALGNLGRTLWAIQYHSLLPQLVMAVLFVVFLMLLTWRFLVAGLWIGLSGNGRLFTVTTVPLVLIPTAGLLLLDEFFGWLLDDASRMQPFVWCVGALAIARYWAAAYTWRGIGRAFHAYLVAWACGTTCMVLLAWLAAEPFGLLINIELAHARSLLLCAALMVMPLAQLGLAPMQFARNRHA